MKNSLILLCILSWASNTAQHVGIKTLAPDAPFHIWSNGQVYTPGGLLLLGNRTDGTLELDFNTLQSYFNGNPQNLRIQPDGGNVGINIPFPSSIDHKFQVNGTMGITSHLYHVGDTDTHLRYMSNDVRIAAGGFDNLIVRDIDIRIGGNSIFVDPAQGEVGIGTITPDHTLDVAGDISLDGNLTHNGDLDTEIQFNNDQLVVKAGNKSFITILEGAPSKFTIGDGSDIDITLNGFLGIDGTDGQVGIGDLNPSSRLSIKSDPGEDPLKVKIDGTTEMIVASDGQVGIGDATPSAKLNINSGASEDPLRVQLAGSTKFFVKDDGRIGVGSTGYFTPSTDFHLRHPSGSSSTGGLSIENSSSSRWQFWVADDGNFYLYVDGTFQGAFVNGTGDYSPLSDFNAKKNIKNISSVLDRVMRLKPSAYQLKSESADADYQLGFIAQDMKKLFPENVRYLEDIDKQVVLYKGVSVLAIKAIQEQQDEIEELRANNIALISRIERLEDLLLKE